MITSIETVVAGTLEFDGGAMFGVVPKSVWEKVYPPEAGSNRCTWTTRCLLIRTDDDRNILIDTGVGEKDGDRFRRHFNPSLPQTLTSHLRSRLIEPEAITDVLFTHLHFDHVGGASYLDANGLTQLTFPNATHWVTDQHWKWANSPNPREAASFLSANLDPLKKSGKLQFLTADRDDYEWLPGISLRTIHGHTTAMQLPMLDLPDGRRFVYCADLLPSAAHLSLPWVMAYDIRPLNTLAEKERLISEALEGGWTLLLEHDARVAGGTLMRNDKARTVWAETMEGLALKY